MEAKVSARIGADRYERSSKRTAQRNGYRARPWDTRLGTLELAIPKLRTPSWLEPRRRAEQALVAVITEAHVQGVSTRKVEALVQLLGTAGISKSEVSRLCAGLAEQARIFRTRRLDAESPYLWLHAPYEEVREDVTCQAIHPPMFKEFPRPLARVASIPPTSSGWSEPARRSTPASSSNAPTNQQAVTLTRHDTLIHRP